MNTDETIHFGGREPDEPLIAAVRARLARDKDSVHLKVYRVQLEHLVDMYEAAVKRADQNLAAYEKCFREREALETQDK